MNILFLVESLDNQTALNLVDAFSGTDHQVDVIPYFSHQKNQCFIEYFQVENVQVQGSQAQTSCSVPALIYNARSYFPSDYDAALLWCWGTADLGRQYLRIFEDQGVRVINSTYATEVTDSKVQLSRYFEQSGIAIPKTLYFDAPLSGSESLAGLEQLGEPPYVFKADYGTRGNAVSFPKTLADVMQCAQELYRQTPDTSGFIVQQFIGSSQRPISHYRALVLGDEVFPHLLKVTASKPMQASNIAMGSTVELVPLQEDIEQLALQAAKSSGLKIAGVDLMVEYTDNHARVVVLEINDGPGTKTFDREGCDASQAVIDYFIRAITAA